MYIKEILSESFSNLFSVADKEKYKDRVWALLTKSYANIGGIKGNGFASAEDMVAKIPFWKIDVRNGTVYAAVLYKDTSGRKAVAIGTDGSNRGILKAREMLNTDTERSYAEVSKHVLSTILKAKSEDEAKQILITPAKAEQMLKKDIQPVTNIAFAKLPTDAQLSIRKFPYLKDFGYLRMIGGEPVFKVMAGTPDMQIIQH